MAKVDFVYDYPYPGYGETGRFRVQWAESRKSLNGSYTYPMVFNNVVTGCRHLKISIEIENTGSGTIFERNWDFMVCKSNGSWVDITTFILPTTGKYTVDCDIGGLDITMFAFVPSSNPGSNRTWDSWFIVEGITLTEKLEASPLHTGMFQYGVFTNQYGVSQRLNEVFANIDGNLVHATDILVNINGRLTPLKSVYSSHITSETETMKLFAFTPPTSGEYTIKRKKISGDHELRLYSNDFTPLKDGYFYNSSFSLTGGALYYISVTHYYYEEESGESYLQIYKED